MRALLALLLSIPAFGTVTIRSVEALQNRVIVRYTAPDNGACRLKISEEADLSPLAKDVDTSVTGTVYPGGATRSGADLDTTRSSSIVNGRDRTAILGTPAVVKSTGLAGMTNTSLALFNQTDYYGEVACGASYADTATFTTRTTDGWPIGVPTRPPPIIDTTGVPLWPTLSRTDRSDCIAEPYTGTRICNFSLPQDVKRNLGPTNFAATALGTNWTISYPGSSTYSNTAQNWLAFKLPAYSDSQWRDNYESTPVNVQNIRVTATAQCSGVNTSDADCTAEACISFDQIACSGTMQEVLFPLSSGAITIGTTTYGDLWGTQFYPYRHKSLAGSRLYNSGASTTVNFVGTSATADCNLLVVNETIDIGGYTPSGGPFNAVVQSKSCGSTPPSIVIDQSINLDVSAITGATGYPWRYYSGWDSVNNPRVSLLIRKKSTTANNTFTLTTPQWTQISTGTTAYHSGGFSLYCNNTVTTVDGNGFHKCKIGLSLYAFNPSTGETRFLGRAPGSSPIQSGQLCQQLGGGSSFWYDDDDFYCMAPRASDSKPAIFRGRLSGDTLNDVDLVSSSEDPAPAGLTWTDMSGDFLALADASALAANFDSTIYTSCSLFGIDGAKVHIACVMGNQDTYGWVFEYNLGNLSPLGSGGNGSITAAWEVGKAGTSTGWSVIHTYFYCPDCDSMAFVQAKAGKNAYANGDALYTINLNDTGLTSSCTPTCTINTTRANGSGWTLPTGVDGTTWVTGEPLSQSGTTPYYLQEFQVGDVLRMYVDTSTYEHVRITAKNSHTNITVTRAIGAGETARNWSTGQQMIFWPVFGLTSNLIEPIPDFSTCDFSASTTCANVAIYSSYNPGGGHSDIFNHYNMGSGGRMAGTVSVDGINTNKADIKLDASWNFNQNMDQPKFAGKYAPHYGACFEGHLSFYIFNYPLIADTHPLIGSCSGQVFTHVSSGTVFRIAYTESVDQGGDDRSAKHFPLLVTHAYRYLRDVSGPGSDIAAAGLGTYCEAAAANECVSGSSAGNIYVNTSVAPSERTNCTLNVGVWSDLCMQDSESKGTSFVSYHPPSYASTAELTRTAVQRNNRGYWPNMLSTFVRPKENPNTNNVKMLPGGWGYYVNIEGYGETPYPSQVIRYKLRQNEPSYSSYPNSTFHPLTVSAGAPSGTSRGMIEFGYDEFGGYCTTRAEACYAVASTLSEGTPFVWGVERTSSSGESCSSSCTVTIPSIPGMALKWRWVYRDSGGTTIKTGQWQVGAPE